VLTAKLNLEFLAMAGVTQIALAKFYRDGDWRSGYYRDKPFDGCWCIFAQGSLLSSTAKLMLS
jgi:hypothetical protein